MATTLQGAKELSLEVNVKTRPPCGVFHMEDARQKKTERSQLGGWVGQKRLTWMLVLAEKMRLWREQHEEMASAVSKSSYPAGVEVHSMVSADEMPELEPLEEGEEEDEREDDPVVEVEAMKKGKDDDDDAQTTVTNAEIMEMHEKAIELELQNVENEDVDDERIFKKLFN